MTTFLAGYLVIECAANFARMFTRVIDAGNPRTGTLTDALLAATYAALTFWGGMLLFG